MRVQQKQIPLSQAQIDEAMRLRTTPHRFGETLSWSQVSQRMKIGLYRVLAHFDPEEMARIRAKRRLYGSKRTPLTQSDRDAIDELRKTKTGNNKRPMGSQPIAARLGLSHDAVRAYLGLSSSYFPKTYVVPKPIIPPEVQEERDRAYLAEVPLSVTLMGDPLPGRSALDKKINL